MNPKLPSFYSAWDDVPFIDHTKLTWGDVRQTTYVISKQFHYAYPGPIRQLRQRLMVVPPDQYGDQQLQTFGVRVIGAEAATSTTLDRFGNRTLSFHIDEVSTEVAFEVTLRVERMGYPRVLPRLDAQQAAVFLAETPLTVGDPRIITTAQELAAEHPEPTALAEAINTWVSETMRYGWGVTSVETTASQALALGRGLCQDYAHIMLALCRAAKLPARYVSGHLLGEGGSHAWVEVLVPDGDAFVALPLDPTNHRRANLSYITIAVGRDYRDVAPTSGSFIAPYPGQLTASKRAGVTRVEYVGA
jgi:transglutaminase-like putative cysteine protease